jgi:glutamate N-acetyltransferase/amino-acid N-acetyltransferase
MDDWAPPPVEDDCYPRGFQAAGTTCGIKASGRPDLALIASDTVAAAAAMYTRNRFAAAPVIVSREHGRRGVRAVVVSSGNANACTGERGVQDARAMCEATAAALGASADQVLVCSTGVIGQPLPLDRIKQGIPRVAQALSPTGWVEAADAIRTTDAFRKMAGRRLTIGGTEARIIGMCKGAGMIHPDMARADMATMLVVLATDARVESGALNTILGTVVESTFHSISVDGDSSTNDTVILLANGAAGNNTITLAGDGAREFEHALHEVCADLARMIVRDGEGATKLVTIHVTGARSDAEARQVARAVANSVLVKMAFLGEDANWGRIVAAIGYSGVEVRPEACSVGFDGVHVLDNGRIVRYDENQIRAALKKPEFTLDLDVGTGGPGQATFWTCDISDAYVKFNAHYRT